MAYFDLEEYGDFSVVRFFISYLGVDVLDEIEQQLVAVLNTASGDIILDMAEVDGAETDMLRFLTRYRRMCMEKGRKLALASVHPVIASDCDQLHPPLGIPIYPTLDEAFEKLPKGETPVLHSGTGGQLLCDRTDCVFNRTAGSEMDRHFCTHEYAQMIGNPRSCKYFRMNWAEVSGETERLLNTPAAGPQMPAPKRPAPPPPASPKASPPPRSAPPPRPARPSRVEKSPPPPARPAPPPKVETPAPPSVPPAPPLPVAPTPPTAQAPPEAPVERPSQVVKKYIEASNTMDFEAESECLAPEMLGGSRAEYVARRKEIFTGLARSGSIPQYYFLRLNRERILGGQTAKVDCVRGEIDSLGRRELRQVFDLTCIDNQWKITEVSSGGRPPRPHSRTRGRP